MAMDVQRCMDGESPGSTVLEAAHSQLAVAASRRVLDKQDLTSKAMPDSRHFKQSVCQREKR